MNRIILLAAAVATIALGPAAAGVSAASAAVTGCKATITLLPDLGCGGQALSVQGHTVVGHVETETGTSLPAYWKDGQLTVIPEVTAGFAGDINPAGEIVGSSGTWTTPFAVVHGITHLLPHGSQYASARRVNARGQIAGSDGDYAARWDSYASDPVLLQPAPGDPISFAKGINDKGEVAGDTEDANYVPRSAIWDSHGAIRVLPSAFGADQPSDLFSINNEGVAVGESYINGVFGPTADQATRWSKNGMPTLIPLLAGTNASWALQLNNRGWVGGVAVDLDFTTFDQSGHHAFVWFGEGPAKTLPVPGLSYGDSESDAHYITEDGTVLGSSGPAGGPDTATVWTCVRPQAYTP